MSFRYELVESDWLILNAASRLLKKMAAAEMTTPAQLISIAKGASLGSDEGQMYARQPNGDSRMIAGFQR